jgi:hypothetical protein
MGQTLSFGTPPMAADWAQVYPDSVKLEPPPPAAAVAAAAVATAPVAAAAAPAPLSVKP